MEHDYRLGDWLVRPQLDRIERGEETVHVKPKPMAVLSRLARARGEVVTRDEIFESVWHGAVISDATLTQCVVELRQALGDSARESRYIETIPKIGFRVVAPVTDAGSEAPPPVSSGAPSRPLLTAAVLAVLLAAVTLAATWLAIENGKEASPAHPKSVAVLPFIDASPEQDQAWFADGLAAELIARLASVPELRVTGQTSSFRFRDPDIAPRHIAGQLGVRYLLEGSVQQEGERMRVTAKLVEAESGFNVWSEVFDRPYADLVAVQDEISESVLTALSVTLSVGRMANISGGTTSVEAFELYQKAWQLFGHGAESHYEGIRLLERAVGRDPEFARAWVALATFYNYGPMALGDMFPLEWPRRADAALETARELEPDLPIVLASTIDLAQTNRRWNDIEHAIRTADPQVLELHPTVLFSRAIARMMVGRCAEALELLQRARVLDPLRPDIASQLAHAYLLNGRATDAVREMERAWALEPSPNVIFAMIGLETSLDSGNPELIQRWFGRVVERATDDTRRFFVGVGERLDNELALRAYLRESFRRDDTGVALDYWIANWAAYAGDTGLAIDALSRTPDPYNLWSPLFSGMRRHPRFVEVLDGLGLVDYWREYGWPDRCRPKGEDGVVCD